MIWKSTWKHDTEPNQSPVRCVLRTPAQSKLTETNPPWPTQRAASEQKTRPSLRPFLSVTDVHSENLFGSATSSSDISVSDSALLAFIRSKASPLFFFCSSSFFQCFRIDCNLFLIHRRRLLFFSAFSISSWNEVETRVLEENFDRLICRCLRFLEKLRGSTSERFELQNRSRLSGLEWMFCFDRGVEEAEVRFLQFWRILFDYLRFCCLCCSIFWELKCKLSDREESEHLMRSSEEC